MGKSIREFLGLNSYDQDNKGITISHEEKYSRIVNEIGIEKLIKLLPVKDKKTLEEKYNEDENLNNIPLKKWDANYSIVRMYLNNIGVTNTSLSDSVCILKMATKIYIDKY